MRSGNGQVVVTIINDSDKPTRKKANIAGHEIILSVPARSIVCVNTNGIEIERLVLPY